MLKLNETGTLEVLLAGAITTSQGALIACYADVSDDSVSCAPDMVTGATNSTTAVTWVDSPAADHKREIQYLSLYNEDTVSMTATVRIVDNGTNRILGKFTLAAGERLEFNVDTGFATASASASGVTSVNGDSGPAVVLGGEDIAEPVNALASSGAITIDCALGDYFTLAATGNMTSFAFSNLPAAGKAQTIMVEIAQDGTGSRIATFPSSFKWEGGVVGVLSTAAGSKDLLALTTFDQGTTVYATLAKAFA